MRQNRLLAGAGVLVLITVSVYGLWALLSADHEPTIDELTEVALNPSVDRVEREQAAAALTQHGRNAAEHLRRLSRESDLPEVRATAFLGLGKQGDFESMDALLDAMEDESIVVRGRAAHAVAKMLGRERPFQARGSEEDRARVIRYYRADWKQLRNAPYFESLKAKVRNDEEN